MEWRSLAPRTRAHTPLAAAWEAVPLGAMHHGPGYRSLLQARNARLSTMHIMRRWRQNVTRTVIPAHPCIFCGGPEEDTSTTVIRCPFIEHMHLANESPPALPRAPHLEPSSRM